MKKMSILILVTLAGCASYQHAQNVKLISFSDNITKNSSTGIIEGQDCTWQVLGYKLGGAPTISKAFLNTQNQAGALESAGLSTANSSNALRYVNNVSTEKGGFDVGIFGKECLIVKGEGHK
ncbi:MAG: hypothetical protein A2381_15570 [Bdellovibrionales bacterium RIFOXYB1_FULL_37_110]|nr:MAG: hypothetical protein A2417_07420 [Bdellovibrionales bacterium RIFOXYC1_FULL_37_79]OFZ57040.1 MAG: hypothetical protein A2381_15570 [Bdellovibrionales bacterium RIFOXYB1_FULL_37_110]OFZ64039.1 MAG: hypothetical protein A2577_16185 [Bdellovibrionales bacterium RIFOXYD1_FULL_36_51]